MRQTRKYVNAYKKKKKRKHFAMKQKGIKPEAPVFQRISDTKNTSESLFP